MSAPIRPGAARRLGIRTPRRPDPVDYGTENVDLWFGGSHYGRMNKHLFEEEWAMSAPMREFLGTGIAAWEATVPDCLAGPARAATSCPP